MRTHIPGFSHQAIVSDHLKPVFVATVNERAHVLFTTVKIMFSSAKTIKVQTLLFFEFLLTVVGINDAGTSFTKLGNDGLNKNCAVNCRAV